MALLACCGLVLVKMPFTGDYRPADVAALATANNTVPMPVTWKILPAKQAQAGVGADTVIYTIYRLLDLGVDPDHLYERFPEAYVDWALRHW